MKRLAATIAVAACLAFSADSDAKNETQRVQFPSGSTGTEITGKLGSGDAVRYVLGAKENQFLTVSLRPDNQETFYIVYVPDGGILYESSQAGNEYYGQLYESGDHVVEVFYNGNVGTHGNYDIVFDISAEQSSEASGDDAESACLAAIAEELDVPVSELTTVSVDWSQAGTSVIVRSPTAEQPWNCAYQDGRVVNLEYMGEG